MAGIPGRNRAVAVAAGTVAAALMVVTLLTGPDTADRAVHLAGALAGVVIALVALTTGGTAGKDGDGEEGEG
ncbi:hypothetical protein HUT13_11740 [Streptomyces harbinensis]|uniref:hypothetical protein n=1 Tax=Streptomyces harbinensis TaxID=1176198 RepID=UPI001591D561|nr:hypothetical protein [Streptomyces harbinensis]QKV69384.1 hypothetical protein HUT13_11740 [Streptomyces harbinensis]